MVEMTKCYFKWNCLIVSSLSLHLSDVKFFLVLLNSLSTGEDEEGTSKTLARFTRDGFSFLYLAEFVSMKTRGAAK